MRPCLGLAIERFPPAKVQRTSAKEIPNVMPSLCSHHGDSAARHEIKVYGVCSMPTATLLVNKKVSTKKLEIDEATLTATPTRYLNQASKGSKSDRGKPTEGSQTEAGLQSARSSTLFKSFQSARSLTIPS